MKKFAFLMAAILLAGCGGSGNAPPVTPPGSSLTGTYSLTGFTVNYSSGTSINEHSSVVTSWYGAMKIGPSTISQYFIVNNVPMAVTGPVTITWTNPSLAGIAHVTDQSGTHDLSFSISGNDLTTYSGVTQSGTQGITFEEWDYWVKISDAFSPTREEDDKRQENMTANTGVLWIGSILNP